jgi:Kef-type K+ transport system membrane component KefB
VVNEGRGLRWPQLAGIAIVIGLLSWLGWGLYLDAGHLLGPASWVSAVVLVAMAILVIGAGLPVRRFLRGEARKSLSPIRASRTLVLAQAAALTGSGVLGWYAAQVAHALSDIDLPGYRDLLWRLLALCVASLVLATAGMLTQRMCRVDPPEDRDSRP